MQQAPLCRKFRRSEALWPEEHCLDGLGEPAKSYINPLQPPFVDHQKFPIISITIPSKPLATDQRKKSYISFPHPSHQRLPYVSDSYFRSLERSQLTDPDTDRKLGTNIFKLSLAHPQLGKVRIVFSSLFLFHRNYIYSPSG